MTPALAFDAGVPHRDRLLDCEEMQDHLAGIRGSATRDLPSIVRVKYQPGRSLRVVYRFSADRRAPDIVSCRTFPAKTMFWRFPADRRLQRIDALLRPAEGLASCFGRAWTRSQLAAYSPEKSAVVACLTIEGDTLGYAKQYASPADALNAEHTQRYVASSLDDAGPLRVPRVLGRNAAAHIVFSDVAPGTPVTDLVGAEFLHGAGVLGAALAQLHGVPIPSHLMSGDVRPSAALSDAASVIGRVQPWLAESAHDVAKILRSTCPSISQPVLLHGDVHLKNAFIDNEAISLIDLDQAAFGSPAVDIGSVVALFRSRAAAGICTRDEADTVISQFLSGYSRVRTLPSDSEIRWHTAAALVTERAVRAISRMRVALLQRLDVLLYEAGRLARPARPARNARQRGETR
jgi:aminoglycoside phosphotransferase